MSDRQASPGQGTQLRTGAPHVVRGGSDVRWLETTDAEAQNGGGGARWLPASLPLSPRDITASGLFQGRTIEFAQTEVLPIVSTETVLREELVVRRTVEAHARTIEERVRHTGVEIEEMPPD
jgi:hypothetical protein